MATVHEAANGYYRFSKGFEQRKGKRVQKFHSLGKEKQTAQILANAIETAWTLLPGGQDKVWTDAALDSARQSVLSLLTQKSPTTVTVPAKIIEPAPADNGPTLFQGLERYKLELQSRFAAKEISEKHLMGTKDRIDYAKRYITDRPLASCDEAFLVSWRRILTARPLGTLQKRIQKTDRRGVPIPLPERKAEPISVESVCNWLVALGMAFDWMARAKMWTPEVIHWRENFTVTKKERWRMMTPDEQHNFGKPKPTYTVHEIAKLYRIALPEMRLFILFGIWCGWTQKEISTFQKKHVKLENGEMFVDKRRSKTGNQGYWWICPEMAALIQPALDRCTSPNDLLVQPEDGQEMLTLSNDYVGNRWDSHRKHLKPSYPFSHLRKLGSQMVENVSGSHELSQIFLAQSNSASKGDGERSGASVAREFYTGLDVQIGIGQSQFERLHEAQRKIYTLIKPILFDPAKIKSVKTITTEELVAV